jgi:predicted metalloprotease with PDZ domain
MNLNYLVKIDNPASHIAQVTINTEWTSDKMTFFLPVWSPGSYMVREYSRHIRSFRAHSENGEPLYFNQLTKNQWQVDKKLWPLKVASTRLTVTYEIYLHEVSVRTSYIDDSHAFLHGPSYLMGVLEQNILNPQIEFRFPPAWSKISTSLKDISEKREVFLYSAQNYDELIDCPVEIGCQETDGFIAKDIPHELAFFGKTYPHPWNVKNDMKIIVETVADFMGGLKIGSEKLYDRYLFITHFIPGIYGGLEHSNSTALHFDPFAFSSRSGYVRWLGLVAHEYFHLWNVKRIRPLELGPFNYQQENYTGMLWLSEGMTSFLDDIFVYRSGLTTLEEYSEVLKDNINSYLKTPGRRFHSAEASSFNAWIKLYRPDENSSNSSLSYYLKGSLVFFQLHAMLLADGKNLREFTLLLWKDHLSHPQKGISKTDFFKLLSDYAGQKTSDIFLDLVENTAELNFEHALAVVGLKACFDTAQKPYTGMNVKYLEERVVVTSVTLDSPGFSAGINAEDEIIALNGMRVLKKQWSEIDGLWQIHKTYDVTVSRLGCLVDLELNIGVVPSRVSKIEIIDRELAVKSLKSF